MRIDDIFRQVQEMMEELEEQMDEVETSQERDERNPFDSGPLGGPFGGSFGGNESAGHGPGQSQGSVVGMDVRTDSDQVVVAVDLPGFSEEDITISVDNERLRVRATASSEMRRETTTRTTSVPADVREQDATATFENGVLTVELPRSGADDDEGTTIDIQ